MSVGVRNGSRGRRLKGRGAKLDTTSARDEPDDLTSAERRARRRAWAQLLRRVYEVTPMTCPKCGTEMKIVSVILDHIRKKEETGPRTPPHEQSPFAAGVGSTLEKGRPYSYSPEPQRRRKSGIM